MTKLKECVCHSGPLHSDGYGNLLFPHWHVKHWGAVPWSLDENLYYFQLWMETITECLLPDESRNAHSHRHTHRHTRMYTRLQTLRQTFRPTLNHSPDKRHPVGLRKEREREREEGRERAATVVPSFFFIHFLPLPPSALTGPAAACK